MAVGCHFVRGETDLFFFLDRVINPYFIKRRDGSGSWDGPNTRREPGLSALLWSAPRACCMDPAPPQTPRAFVGAAGTRTDARGRACCLVGVMRSRWFIGNGGARTEKAAPFLPVRRNFFFFKKKETKCPF